MTDRILYLDCDGVLADFDNGARLVFDGMFPAEFESKHGTKEFWKRLTQADDFFFNLEPMPDAHELWENVKHLHPIIITGCPVGGWAETQKHRWVRKHFGRRANVITCASRDKSIFCHPGDVIVDDWEKHKPKWEAKGGHWILHKSAEQSLLELHFIGMI